MIKKNSPPRIEFIGTGWIGRHRMQAIQLSKEAQIAAIADVSGENAQQAPFGSSTIPR